MSKFLRDICEREYFRLNSKIRSDKTRRHYRFAIANLATVVGHPPTLDDLTDDNVTAVMMDLLERGRSIRTANERRDRLNAFWNWLARRGRVTKWPTTARMAEPERVPRGWHEDQLPQLFQAFDKERVLIGGVPAPKWWRSLHLALWDSMERIGALIQCRWEHLNPPWLVIPAELRKAKRADKAHKLGADTLAALEEIRQPARDEIWPWPYNRFYLWSRYKTIRRRAGLPTDRYSSFHRMRKSAASHFEAAGGNATEALGHESRRTTLAYLDPTITKPTQPADLLFRIDAKGA